MGRMQLYRSIKVAYQWPSHVADLAGAVRKDDGAGGKDLL